MYKKLDEILLLNAQGGGGVFIRQIYNDSIRMKILFYLHNYGDTKRCDFISIYTEHHRQSVQAAIVQLLNDQFIGQYSKRPPGKPNPVRYLTLTAKGKEAVLQLESEHGEQSTYKEVESIRRPERKEKVLQVYNLLKSENILIDEKDKPPLSFIFSQTPAPISEEIKEKLLDMQDMGAFFSITEIRQSARTLFGDGPLNQTRCLGVLIRHKQLFLIYNMGSRLIYFNDILEKRTQQTILSYFRQGYHAGEILMASNATTAPCILFGESYECIPRLFYASKYGKLKLEENGEPVDYGQWDMNKERLTMQNLNDVFPVSYFVSIRVPNSMTTFITETTQPEKDAIVSAWAKENTSIRTLHDGGPARFEIRGLQEKVFVWFDNSLSELYSLYKSETPVHVVIPTDGPEKAISKILGKKLLSIQTVTGKLLHVPRYTNTGHLIREYEDD